MRTLVAGGAGFVGANLCEVLLAAGHKVVCVDNLVTGRRSNIEGLLGRDGFHFLERDVVEDLSGVPQADWIFHLASPASPRDYQLHALETMRVNSEGTLALLQLSEHWQARFLYASTSEIYGDPLEHPQKEEQNGNVSPTGPRSMYDEAKRYGEALTALFHREGRADTRIVRIFNTYGPLSDVADGRIVPNFVTQALMNRPLSVYGNGLQTRSLCFVTDMVRGLVAAMSSEGTGGEVINLGNPEEHTVIELAEIIRDMCGSESAIEFSPPAVGDDPHRRRPDIDKARRLLGWTPHVALRTGLLETIAYFEREIGTPIANSQ